MVKIGINIPIENDILTKEDIRLKAIKNIPFAEYVNIGKLKPYIYKNLLIFNLYGKRFHSRTGILNLTKK